MQTMTLEQFVGALKGQGVPQVHWALKCPICGTVQSAADLIEAGAGETFDDVEQYLGFACIGRFTDAGEHKEGEPPGRGCNWSLGGLFHLHKLEVITDDGTHHPRFEPATPGEAQEHMASSGVDDESESLDQCGVAKCIGCGCDDFHACHDEKAGHACYWLRVDRQLGRGVCSCCEASIEAWDAGNRETQAGGEDEPR